MASRLTSALCSAALSALVLGAWSGPVAAQDAPDPETQLGELREMVLYARYDEAQQGIEGVLSRSDLEPAQRNAALELQATILIARNEIAAAREVLGELYRRDPGHRLVDRDASPRVRAAFERAHDAATEPATVSLANDTPDSLTTRRPPVISVRLSEGADLAQEVRLSYRLGDSGAFERAIMRFGETRAEARSRIPPPEGTESYEVQYFIEALAPSLSVLGGLGSAREPLRLSVPEATTAAAPNLAVSADPVLDGEEPAGGGSVLEEWWLWTLIGVVVVGAGVGIGVWLGLDGPGQAGPGTLGEGTL